MLHKRRIKKFLEGICFGLLTFALILFGVYIGDNKSMKEYNEQYDRGYDQAVKVMIECGYYIDKNRHRHTGEWIEKEEENV